MSSTIPTDAGPGPRFRASDVERMAVAQVLQDAVARGLLTPDEGSERTRDAFAAKYRDELPALTVDLPPAPSDPPDRRPGLTGSRSAAAQTSALGMWLALLGLVSRWSPRQRILAAALMIVLLALLGLVFWGGGGGHHGFDRGGLEHLHQ